MPLKCFQIKLLYLSFLFFPKSFPIVKVNHRYPAFYCCVLNKNILLWPMGLMSFTAALREISKTTESSLRRIAGRLLFGMYRILQYLLLLVLAIDHKVIKWWYIDSFLYWEPYRDRDHCLTTFLSKYRGFSCSKYDRTGFNFSAYFITMNILKHESSKN